MTYLYYPKKMIIVSILFLLSICCHAQISKEGVVKKYQFKDTIGKNDAVLVLYADETFVNFGIVCNEQEKEWYVWLTSGNYLALPGKILLKSTLEINQMNPLLNNIKNYYKYRADHALIANGYEYQLETYKDLPMMVDNEKLKDLSKKIEYKEVK